MRREDARRKQHRIDARTLHVDDVLVRAVIASSLRHLQKRILYIRVLFVCGAVGPAVEDACLRNNLCLSIAFINLRASFSTSARQLKSWSPSSKTRNGR